MRDVLLLYSGGLDSLLSLCRLVSEGYNVYFIHFDNGSSIGIERVSEGAKIIEKRLEGRARYLGVVSTVGIFNSFKQIENLSFSDIANKYGNASISQYQCLLCRSAMYERAIGIALQHNIHYIAEGARVCQKFAIEQAPMIEEYRRLVERYDIKLLTPVWDLKNDYDRLLEISDWGFDLTPYEERCFLGYPIDENHPVDKNVVNDIVRMYRDLVLPCIEKDMNSEYRIGHYKHLQLGHDKVFWL